MIEKVAVLKSLECEGPISPLSAGCKTEEGALAWIVEVSRSAGGVMRQIKELEE